MSKAYCPIMSKELVEGALDESFPWTASEACQDWQSLANKEGEQVTVDTNWKELINSSGQPVWYYPYKFDLRTADKIRGEDPLTEYDEPFEIYAYLEVKDVPKELSIMGGFFSEDTVTGYIHIKTFRRKVKDIEYYKTPLVQPEPKPGDLIQIISFGCDRPGDRGANYYEITNKEDQLISASMNAAYGHYVWKITAKRFMFSHEGGAIEQWGEDGNCQVYENYVEGKLEQEKIEDNFQDKKYPFNVDKESKEKIFNQNLNNNDSIYGGYYEM